MLKSVWSERYRPTQLRHLANQDAVIAELMCVVSGDFPPQHYLFHSQKPGTGKTSVARAFANEMGWPIHEFNASTKRMRGIEFVEEELIPLSTCGISDVIFLLDEADQLTPAAQSALKGVIENSQGIFILTCNDLSKISEWIQSRVAIREFEPIDESWMEYILRNILAQENEYISDHHLRRVCASHEGDMRSAINAIQSLCCLNDEAREALTLEWTEEGLNYELFLRMCFRDRDIESACGLLKGYDTRKVIQNIFDFAIASSAAPQSKMLITEAAIIAQRDCINGVDNEMVKWAFCTILCGGFIGQLDTGQGRTR